MPESQACSSDLHRGGRAMHTGGQSYGNRVLEGLMVQDVPGKHSLKANVKGGQKSVWSCPHVSTPKVAFPGTVKRKGEETTLNRHREGWGERTKSVTRHRP